MMKAKASNEELIAAYAESGNVWRVAERFGMCGQSVHERLTKLGAMRKWQFTDEERSRIMREYADYRRAWKVAEMAKEMGRTVSSLSKIAREYGLTTHRYPKHYAKWKYMSEDSTRALLDQFKRSPLLLYQWCQKNKISGEGFSETCRKFFPDEWDHVIESKTPLTSMYRLGRQVEYRARDILRNMGYFVLRSPASKSPIDLVAIKPGVVLMIQCKRSGSLQPKPWNELLALAESCGAVPILAERSIPRHLRFWKLLGRKDGSRRGQPMEAFDPAIADAPINPRRYAIEADTEPF